MQYRPLAPGIEVNGQTVWSIVDGFKTFTYLASNYLLAEGVGRRGRDGLVEIDREGWYSQEGWLRAFERIGSSVGDRVLAHIGEAIPKNAAFPDWVQDVRTGVQSIDIAYHMNHRRDGKPMFDPLTQRMLEGIGHYGYEPVHDSQRIYSTCDTPFPCAFDWGIVRAMAKRFAPTASVTHEPRGCRKEGASSCTYLVTW